MKVVHLVGRGGVGGEKIHILSLVKELSKNIEVKIIALKEGSFSREARKMGLDIEVVKSKNFIKGALYLIKMVKNGGYDFIHAHGARANLFAKVCGIFAKVCVITTVHNDYKLDYLQNIVKRYTCGVINSIALKFMNFYITVSNDLRYMLINRNFSADKIYTVYNGIDFDVETKVLKKSDTIRKYNIAVNNDDVLVGILTKLHSVKDVQTFLDAVPEVLKLKKNIKFIIGSDGEPREILKNYAKRLGIASNVLFTGFVDNPYELVNILDINVSTSTSEVFPYSILEGIKLKKAIISVNVDGVCDLINHNENGYLFGAGDYKTLAKYIVDLINDDNKRIEFGSKLYKKAKSEFSIEKMGKTQLDIYYDIKRKLGDPKYDVRNNYDILISGYYGHNNMGDEAMLEAIIETFRKERKDIKLVVLSQKPELTTKVHNIKSIYRFDLFEIFKALIKTKVYINGGGSLIQDNTSNRSLYYYLTLILMAKLTRTEVMIYANGIGPINSKINRFLTGAILNLVDVITVRDENSLCELDKLKVRRPKIELTADSALTLESVDKDRIKDILKSEGIDENSNLIGFSIRQWGKNMDYVETIAKVADIAYKKYNLEPVFIVMQKSGDLKISKDIAKKMETNSHIISGSYSPKEILGLIGRLEILVGMRLHALIFASMSSVPCLGVVYEQKVEGFINSVRQLSAGNVQELKVDKLTKMLDEVYQDRRILKEYLLSIKRDLIDKSKKNAKLALELLDTKRNKVFLGYKNFKIRRDI